MAGSNVTGLAGYIINTFNNFKKDRAPLEGKYQRNLDLLKGKDIEKVWKVGEGEGWRSKTFIKRIKPKVFAAYAMILDVLLAGGKIPFSLKLIESEMEEAPIVTEEQQGTIAEDLLGAIEEESLPTETSRTAADDMSDKIADQLEERKADREYMKKAQSMLLFGLTWSKYTVAEVDIPSLEQENNTWSIKREKKKVPGHEYRSVWSMFTDKEDDDLQKNLATIEIEMVSAYDLRQYKTSEDETYIHENINHALETTHLQKDTPDETSLPPGMRDVTERVKNIEKKIFWGRAPRKLVEEFEAELKKRGKAIEDYSLGLDPETDKGDDLEIMAEVASNDVIRFALKGDEKRPYKRAVMEDPLDDNEYTGIADNMEDVQVMFNGLVRAYEDNKKLSSNIIFAKKSRYFEPGALDEWKPGDNFEVSEACDDVRKALMQVLIEDVGESLISGITMAQQWEDDVSQVPKITQGGLMAKQEPDTAFAMNQLMQAAGKYFGMVIRNIDESLIEPETTDIYHYNMTDPEYMGEKALCKIHATGFSGYQNKVIRAQKVQELLAMGQQSEPIGREQKVRAHLEELYKILDVDPDQFLKSEEEKQQDMVAQEKARMDAEAQIKAEEEERLRLEADIESKGKEEEFQRDIIKKQLDAAEAKVAEAEKMVQ